MKLDSAYLTDVTTGAGRGPILAASPDGVFSSPDGGSSWKLARVGSVGALCTLGDAGFAAGGSRGVLRADSAGKGWAESNAGLAATSIYSLATSGASRTTLVAATARGLFFADGGETWKRLPGTPETVEFISVTPASAPAGGPAPDLLVGSSGQIGRSFGLDGSWSWLPAPAVFGFSLDPAHAGRAFAATRGAPLRSEDGGVTWEGHAEGLTRTFPLQLAVDPANASTIYAATAGSGVYRSTNGGRAWKPFGPELSRTIVRCLANTSGGGDTGASGGLFAGTDRGIFMISAGAKEWTPLSGGLPRSPVYALLADSESPGRLYAGTAEGLFFTRDTGRSWTSVPAAIVPGPVTSLVLDRAGRRVYAGTLGAGVFAVALPE